MHDKFARANMYCHILTHDLSKFRDSEHPTHPSKLSRHLIIWTLTIFLGQTKLKIRFTQDIPDLKHQDTLSNWRYTHETHAPTHVSTHTHEYTLFSNIFPGEGCLSSPNTNTSVNCLTAMCLVIWRTVTWVSMPTNGSSAYVHVTDADQWEGGLRREWWKVNVWESVHVSYVSIGLHL